MQMMPSRDELIEKMAAAMYEAKFAHDWKWCGSFREVFLGKAETALQALLESLPSPDPFCFCKGNEVLKKLLEMRE